MPVYVSWLVSHDIYSIWPAIHKPGLYLGLMAIMAEGGGKGHCRVNSLTVISKSSPTSFWLIVLTTGTLKLIRELAIDLHCPPVPSWKLNQPDPRCHKRLGTSRAIFAIRLLGSIRQGGSVWKPPPPAHCLLAVSPNRWAMWICGIMLTPKG